MLNRLQSENAASRLAVVGLLCFSAIIASMGTLKLYLPSQTSWLLIGVPLLAAAYLEIKRRGWLKPVFEWKQTLPLVVFLATIVLAMLLNDLSRDALIFSVSTIVKFVLLWVLLLVLIQTRVKTRTMEVAFTAALIAGALGFGLTAILNAGLMISGDDRFGWPFAWYGLFWKMGMYAFPFFMWRSLRNPSWTDLPGLLMATLVVSLDASRTGLLAVLICFAAMLVIGVFVFRLRNVLIGVAMTIASFAMSYMIVQPAMLGLGRQGEIAQHYVGWTLVFGALALAATELGRVWGQGSARSLAVATTTATFDRIEKAIASRRQQNLRPSIYVAAIGLMICATLTPFAASRPAPAQVDAAPGATVVAPVIQPGTSDVTVVERFATADTARLDMLKSSLAAAVDNFPFGGGLGTTSALGMHVHFTYIQLAGDVGLLGLVSYLGIFVVFGIWFFGGSGAQRIALVPGVAVIGVFMLQSAFAPLTNELTEWFPVLLAAAAFYAARTTELSREKAASR